MTKRFRTLAVGLLAASVFATTAAPRPAAAQSTGTINTILGAAAVIGGLILYNNYQHKRQAANNVVGYTRNGGTVYGDGRIVMPNGQTLYPNANGQYPWGQYAYYHPNFQPGTVVYDYDRSGRYDSLHRHSYAREVQWERDRQAELIQAQRIQAERLQYQRNLAERNRLEQIRIARMQNDRLAERNRIERDRIARLEVERNRAERRLAEHREHNRDERHDRR